MRELKMKLFRVWIGIGSESGSGSGSDRDRDRDLVRIGFELSCNQKLEILKLCKNHIGAGSD